MQTKKLGFGLMRLPLTDRTDAGAIDVEQVKRMVDTFLERGLPTLTPPGCTAVFTANRLQKLRW